MIDRLAVAAIVAAAAAAVTFAAAPARADISEPRTAEVGYADLNLSSRAGQATLDRRIAQAATIVCGGHASMDLRQRLAFNSCRGKAIAGAARQVAERRGEVVLASR
jgi:UrcA family protein